MDSTSAFCSCFGILIWTGESDISGTKGELMMDPVRVTEQHPKSNAIKSKHVVNFLRCDKWNTTHSFELLHVYQMWAVSLFKSLLP